MIGEEVLPIHTERRHHTCGEPGCIESNEAESNEAGGNRAESTEPKRNATYQHMHTDAEETTAVILYGMEVRPSLLFGSSFCT